MKLCLITIFFIIATWHCIVAPPVTKNKENEIPPDVELLMHYHRYLKEVVGALEKDPDFKKKIESANEDDIKSGKIANELEFVSHHVRNQLDEFKRQELMRLRSFNKIQHEFDGNGNDIHEDPNHGHVDHRNPHTFEVSDLKKLITKTMENLEEHDRKRRESFKEYELQKEFDKLEKLNHTNGDEHEKLEREFKEREEKHKKHEPLHEPGHKAQLEEVWEEQDHMQQEFDPKTFFMMHDLDSNGLWDQDEVKALFVKELNKMYDNAAEDDMVERREEMERMRETVFHQMDTNKDGFIDYSEFLAQTKRQDYQEDHGWKGLDEEKPYTDEELEAYIRQQQQMHAPPYYPPPGAYHPPPGAYNPNMPPPGAYNPQQGGYHPNQVPHGGYQGHPPNQQYQPPPPQQAQYHQNQIHPNLNTNEIYQGGQHGAQQPQGKKEPPAQVQQQQQQQPPSQGQGAQPPVPAQQNYQQPPPPQVQQNYQQPPQVQQHQPPPPPPGQLPVKKP